MVMLRKANAHSFVNYRLIKKINNVTEDPRRKTDLNLDFSEAVWCLLVFKKTKCYAVHNSFYTKRGLNS